MGLLKTLKNLITGDKTSKSSSTSKGTTSKSSSSAVKKANRITNYGGGGSSSYYEQYGSSKAQSAYRARLKKEDDERKKRKEAFRASDPKTSANYDRKTTSESKTETSKPSTSSAFKATPPKKTVDVKEQRNTTEGVKKALDKGKREAFATALQPRVEAKYSGATKESKLRTKMGEWAYDPEVAMYETAKHPIANSLARGGVSGVTFGVSELAAKKLPKNNGMDKAEEYYQKNKNKAAEVAGEIGASLASFGLTSGASKAAIKGLAPEATERLGANATERLATNKWVMNAARKEAMRKLGANATEDAIANLARERAAKIVAAVGEDMAINLTTGAVSDVAHAMIDSDNPIDFAKNMAMNVGMNLAVGGGAVVAPELLRTAKPYADNVAEAAGRKLADTSGKVNMGEIDDALRGYSSTGSRKKASEASKLAEELMAKGDTKGARAEIEKAVDDIVRNTKNEEPLDDTIKAIKEDLKNANIKVSEKTKADAGYKSGGYNEFRKKNFAGLRLTEKGRPVDDLWLSLQEKYGPSLFPDEISNESDQLQYLAELVGRKGKLSDLADDEANYLKGQLTDSMWKSVGGEADDAMNMRSRLDAIQAEMDEAYNRGDLDEVNRLSAEASDIEMRLGGEDDATSILEEFADTPAPKEASEAENILEEFADEPRKPKPDTKTKSTLRDKGKRLQGSESYVKPEDIKPVAKKAKTEKPKAKVEAEALPGKEAWIKELDEKGETRLGRFGHIEKKKGGKYNLFVNGEGDKTLTRKEVEEYIDKSVSKLHADEERIKKTRTTPLTKKEKTRIKEIDDEIARLNAESKADVEKHGSKAGYKGVEGYWDRQAERGQKITALENEKRRIEIKEPKSKTKAKAEPKKPSKVDVDLLKGVDDDIPVNDIEQTRLNDSVQETMAKEPKAKKPKPLKDVKKEEPAVTPGQSQARKAYEKATGESFEANAERATDEQIYEAVRSYEKSQGESAERKLSRAAMSQVGISDKKTADILNDIIKKSDDFEYGVIHQKDMYEEVAKNLADDWDGWIDKLADVAEKEKWEGKEGTKLLFMGQYLSEITDATASAEQAALANTAWKAIKTLASSSAQTLNGRSAFVKLSRSAKIESALDDLVKVLDTQSAGVGGFNWKHRKALRGLNKYERQHYIKGQLMGDQNIHDAVIKLINAKSEEAVGDAYAELLLNFNKKYPKSGIDVVQELRYLSMLGNPKTHIRNMGGSGFFAPIRQVSNAIRSGIEKPISKWANLDVVKHGGLSPQAVKETWTSKPTTEAGKKALEASERRAKDILGGAKYDTPQYKGRARTIPGKVLDAASDFNSMLLTKEDDFFRKRAFKENYIKSYNAYEKAGVPITKKIEKAIEEEAVLESQIATFNEANNLANWMNNISKKMYDPNANGLTRAAGAGFNAVMPFTKVPANILNQSVNYSPLGLARGFAGIRQAAKSGDAAALNRAIDTLASGMTGSMIFAAGMYLGGTTDMFTTNAGKNDYAAKFKKAQGVQNYSVKANVDGQDYSITLDWLVPNTAAFFSGVELANELFKGEGFSIKDFGGDWAQVTSRLIEPVMETSMLSGLYSMLESTRNSYGDDDQKSALDIMGREIVQSYLNSFVPTLLGQAARTKYASDLEVVGDTDWEYWRNSIKSKTGLGDTDVLGEELGAATDAYGNVKGEKKTSEDRVKSALKNFISPANIQKIDLSELDKQKIAEYEQAIKDGKDPADMAYLFPKKQYRKQFSVGDEEVKMSNKDVSTYNQAKKTGGADGMRAVLENYMFNQYEKDEDGKRTVLKDGYTKEEKAKLIKQFEGKSIREVEEWLHKQPQFKSASPADQKKAIDQLWNLTQEKAKGSQLAGERAVYKAQGKDGDEYDYKNEVSKKKQENLQPFIEDGTVSYKDAVDFARNAGKTYYYPGEDDDSAGTSKTYYNKKQMMEYLLAKGYSEEEAAALFNSFKASNAKEYGSSSSRRGYRRRGYRRRGYGRSGGSGTASGVDMSAFKAKASLPNPKSSVSTTVSVPKADKLNIKQVKGAKTKNATSMLDKAMKDIQTTQKKVAPPRAKKGTR